MKKDVIILHGTMGSPDGNWFPWLKSQLENDYNVYVLTFPTPENQSKDNWCAALRDQAPIFGKDTILIGHSLGATLMMHILEMMDEPVHQSIFVCPVLDQIGNEEYDTLNKTFVEKMPNFDWDTMSQNKGKCTIFMGDNDPYVPASHAQTLHKNIGGELIVIPNGGHLNAESGYTEFKELLEIIKTAPELPKLEASVTYLEMNSKPNLIDTNLGEYTLKKEDLSLKQYIDLYREIGRDYIWNYRPGQTDEEIQSVINAQTTVIYVLYQNDTPIGMAEIDKSDPSNTEIVHFGLLPRFINKGIGKLFFQKVLFNIWQEPTKRLFLSTCGLDHPKAPEFYKNAGFQIFKTTNATFIDYRYSDFYEMTDAPQIPHGETKNA